MPLEKRDYLDKIIDSMSDSLIVINLDATIHSVNQTALRLSGYEEEELIGKPLATLLPEKESREKALPELSKSGCLTNYETNCKTRSGKAIPVLLSGSVLKDSKGKPAGIALIATDITRRKKTEAALEESHARLKIAQAQLIQTERMSAMGKLAEGVAHEIKNPLTIILQGINYVENVLPVKTEDILNALHMIKKSVIRADDIIRSLLAFSKNQELTLRPEDVNSILENSFALLKHKLQLAHIKIIKETEKDLPEVLGDKGRLERVFVNLLLNSTQTMPEGGI